MARNFLAWNFIFGFLCCLILVQGISDGVADGKNDESLSITTIVPNDKTESTTTPTTTTPAPTTTTPETTTTTPTTTPTTKPSTTTKPTTTTKSTTTTTPSTTTTASTTPSTPLTTPPPPSTSTTTVSPSTTPAPPGPTPLPDPVVGSWSLRNSTTNLTCVMIQMALRIKVPYISTYNKTEEWGQLNLVKDANITGKCDDESIKSNVTQVRLWWSNNTNYLDVTFKKYNDSKTFNITRLYLTQNVSGAAFPNNSASGMMNYQGNGSGLFAVESIPLGNAYRCSHKANVDLAQVNPTDPKARSAVLTFSKVQIQAFVNNTSGNFGAVYDCPGMDASDIVPIAVGCALAALVIAVLIAYLIGRRRSHARGYLSM